MPAPEALSTLNNPKRIKEKELMSWSAPARPFKRRNREFYTNLFAMAGIVGLVLFLIEGWMPVVLIVSVLFLYYVMNTIEPESVTYKLTNLGVKIEDSLSPWETTTRFWFTKRLDSPLLVLEILTFPGRLELVLNEGIKESVRIALLKYINEEKAPPSFLDRASNLISKKIN